MRRRMVSFNWIHRLWQVLVLLCPRDLVGYHSITIVSVTFYLWLQKDFSPICNDCAIVIASNYIKIDHFPLGELNPIALLWKKSSWGLRNPTNMQLCFDFPCLLDNRANVQATPTERSQCPTCNLSKDFSRVMVCVDGSSWNALQVSWIMSWSEVHKFVLLNGRITWYIGRTQRPWHIAGQQQPGPKQSQVTVNLVFTIFSPFRSAIWEMGVRDFVAVPDNFENFNTSVREAGDAKSPLALLEFRQYNSGGSITIFSSMSSQGSVMNVTQSKNKSAWTLSSASNQNLITATRRKTKSFLIEMGKKWYLMRPDEKVKSNYNVYRSSGDAKSPKNTPEALVCTIKVESIRALSYRMSCDSAREIPLPMFCFWLMTITNAEGINLRRPKIRKCQLKRASQGISLATETETKWILNRASLRFQRRKFRKAIPLIFYCSFGYLELNWRTLLLRHSTSLIIL